MKNTLENTNFHYSLLKVYEREIEIRGSLKCWKNVQNAMNNNIIQDWRNDG